MVGLSFPIVWLGGVSDVVSESESIEEDMEYLIRGPLDSSLDCFIYWWLCIGYVDILILFWSK